jgi:transposase
MAKPILEESLWEFIAPLLPQPRPRRRRYPGRKPLDNRAALSGILFVLRSGIPWELLPQELGFGSGMTCWRRLRDWQAAGIWNKIHAALLSKLHQADKIDWSRAVVDSASVRAVFGGRTLGQTPRIAGKAARNTTSRLTPMASLFRRRLPRPIAMM